MKFDVVFEACAGLDVHKRTVEATVRWIGSDGRPESLTRKFGTMTRDLRELRDWLMSRGVTHVAMESTGVFWKPVYNCLESHMEVWLVNARHVKNVPGRKTDASDSQWLAKLLQAGLLQPSFVPPREIRDLRDLTRQRSQFISEKTRVVNRIHKTLEDANIKLGSVATDIVGVSGRAMLKALIDEKIDPEQLADLAKGRLRKKIPELQLALEGFVTEHHRYLLKMFLEHLEHLDQVIELLDNRIRSKTAVHREALDRLDAIPGVDERVAQTIIAEIGPDMDQFPTHKNLASWAGMSPGNNESAGKRKSGKTTKGSRWLRAALVQAAWAASRTKDSYLSAQFGRIVRRRGRKRAMVAVGHSILVIVYNMLKHGTPYNDLGGDFFDKLEPDRLRKYHVRRLEELGHNVELTPREEVA
jgi:transposase